MGNMKTRKSIDSKLAVPILVSGAFVLVAVIAGFSNSYSPPPQRQIAFAPSLGPKPSNILIPNDTPTVTPVPRDIVLSDTLTAQEQRAIRDALELLRNCAPYLYSYVRSYIRLITRGDMFASKEVIGYIQQGETTLYLPKGTILGDNAFRDSVRALLTAANMVHEARHIEMGRESTEPDAYRFELQVFVSACYPPDVEPSVFDRYRQHIEADANR